MTGKPKILYVTSALYAPPHAGCMLRTTNICRQLKKYSDLTMLAVAQSSSFVLESVELCQQEFQPFYKVNLKSYASFPGRWGAILKKWHMHNPLTHGIRSTQKDQAMFEELVDGHDIVWFHTLGAAHPFKGVHNAKSIIDLDDLRDSYYKQYADLTASIRFQWSARVQAYKWKRHQNEALKTFDRVVVCSKDDKAVLGEPEKVRVIPNGYMVPKITPKWITPDPDRLGFIGLLTYPPNHDGLVWFRDNVWPLIRKEKPKATLRIIGKRPKPEYYIEGEGFEYLGFLEETLDEMKTWSALVVPITYGGGTRLKIVDAFSKMTPVVSTGIGAHGNKAENENHILIADNPKKFAAYCLELLNSQEKGRLLAHQAWQLFNENYSWDVIGDSLNNIVKELIS